MFKCSLGSLGAFPILDDLVSRKRLIVERNSRKSVPHGQVFSVYRVLLTVKYSKFNLGSFGAISFFDDLVHVVSRKRLVVERNRPKCGPQG